MKKENKELKKGACGFGFWPKQDSEKKREKKCKSKQVRTSSNIYFLGLFRNPVCCRCCFSAVFSLWPRKIKFVEEFNFKHFSAFLGKQKCGPTFRREKLRQKKRERKKEIDWMTLELLIRFGLECQKERERKTSSLELLTLGLEDRLSHKQTDTFCQKGNAADRQAGWPVD